MAAPLLEVTHVSKEFCGGRVCAVKDVSFTIAAERPEIVAVSGEAKAGKSTLARMILAAIPPSAGTIRFGGRDLTALRGHAARLAFMAQVQAISCDPFEAFNPMKPVERYLRTSARRFARARSPLEMYTAISGALQKVELTLREVRRRYPHALSAGQLQRVAMARALIPRPALLVADEPLAMVDVSQRVSILNLFRRLRDEMGISTLYVTRDLADASYVSDRILLMRRGEVVEAGETQTVLAAPRHPYAIQLKEAALSVDEAGIGRLRAGTPAAGSPPPRPWG